MLAAAQAAVVCNEGNTHFVSDYHSVADKVEVARHVAGGLCIGLPPGATIPWLGTLRVDDSRTVKIFSPSWENPAVLDGGGTFALSGAANGDGRMLFSVTWAVLELENVTMQNANTAVQTRDGSTFLASHVTWQNNFPGSVGGCDLEIGGGADISVTLQDCISQNATGQGYWAVKMSY